MSNQLQAHQDPAAAWLRFRMAQLGLSVRALAEVPLENLPNRLPEADDDAWQRFVIRTIERTE